MTARPHSLGVELYSHPDNSKSLQGNMIKELPKSQVPLARALDPRVLLLGSKDDDGARPSFTQG